MADMKPLVWAYKFSREVARRMLYFRGEPAVAHPSFAPGGPASIIGHTNGPIALDAPRIVYSAEDERVLEEWIRATSA
jgi:alcohol oxidase